MLAESPCLYIISDELLYRAEEEAFQHLEIECAAPSIAAVLLFERDGNGFLDQLHIRFISIKTKDLQAHSLSASLQIRIHFFIDHRPVFNRFVFFHLVLHRPRTPPDYRARPSDQALNDWERSWLGQLTEHSLRVIIGGLDQ